MPSTQTSNKMKPSRKLLFLLNVDWFFISHRLPIAIEAIAQRMEVHVACGITDRKDELEKYGLIVHPIDITRSGLNVFAEIRTLKQFASVIRKIRPDVTHSVTIKPVLYGNILGRLFRVPRRVSSISGLGYVFLAKGVKASLLRGLIGFLYRRALGGSEAVIFQNTADRDSIKQLGALKSSQEIFIRGSGVNLSQYNCSSLPTEPAVVALISRLLIDKGVYEFVEAARILKKSHPSARLVLVGDVDSGNPKSVGSDELERWVNEGVVEYWGFSDVPSTMPRVNIVALPSYREGLPKSLIEAAACGRPVVTTDVPGCRDAIDPGITGMLVPARDAAALAEAIGLLVDSPELQLQMGQAGRELAERAFRIEDVVRTHITLYQRDNTT